MKKSVIAFGACALFTIATAHAQRGPVALAYNERIPFESKTVTGIPYSAELVSENIQTLADGNRIVQRTTGRVYRDSEGRVRREEDRASGGPSISITDVVARTSFSLNTERHEATQTPMPFIVAFAKKEFAFTTSAEGQRGAQEADARKRELAEATERRGAGGRGAAPADADRLVELKRAERQLERVQEELKIGRGFVATVREESVEDKLQDRLIGGVLAAGTRRTTTIAAGAIGNERPIKIVSEEWSSPELQILVMTEHTDPRTGRSTYQLSNINRNEPDPSLFQIPADYTIRKNGIK
jgi:hypothetical protein